MLWPVCASAQNLRPSRKHARRFQLEAVVGGQVAVELQDLARLHHLEALGHHGQRRLGIRAVQHLLLREGVDDADAVVARDDSGLRTSSICQSMPACFFQVSMGCCGASLLPRPCHGLLAGIGHRFNQVHCRFLVVGGINAQGPDMPGLVRCACSGMGQGVLRLLQPVHLTMPTRTAVATTRTQ